MNNLIFISEVEKANKLLKGVSVKKIVPNTALRKETWIYFDNGYVLVLSDEPRIYETLESGTNSNKT